MPSLDSLKIRTRHPETLLLTATAQNIDWDLRLVLGPNETLILWSASLENNTKAATPVMILYTGLGNVHKFPQASATLGANQCGCLTDAAFFPIVLTYYTPVRFRDITWAAGNKINVYLRYTKVQEGVDY